MSRRASATAALTLALLMALSAGGLLACRSGAQQPSPWETEQLLQQAKEAARTGDALRAAELFLACAEALPGDTQLAVRAAHQLGQVGRFNDAIALLKQRARTHPETPVLASTLARLMLLKAEAQSIAAGVDQNVLFYYEEASRLCADTLDRHPDDRDCRLILAQCLYQLGRTAEAAVQASEAIQRFPGHPGGSIMLGRLALDRFRQQRTLGARLGNSEQEVEQRKQHRAAAALAQAEAQKLFEAAVRIDPARTFPLLMLGDLALLGEDMEQALVHYRHALVVDPAARVNHDALARQLQTGERLAFYRGALAEYEGRADADADSAALLRWYVAKTLLDTEQLEPALEQFEQVLAVRPNDLSARYYAAVAAWWLGRHDRATEHAAVYAAADAPGFADTVRALPAAQQKHSTDLIRYVAAVARDQGNMIACRDLNRVVAFVMGTAAEWNNYALLCWELGQHQEAYQGYLKALKIEPDSPQLLNDAGAVLQHHLPTPANLAAAREYYKRAIERADAILADPEVTLEQKAAAGTARANALMNLAELEG